MADFYALTSNPLPKRLHGSSADCSIRTLSSSERLQIEDRFFDNSGVKSSLDSATTSIVVAQPLAQRSSAAEYATLIEFVLAILTAAGFQAVDIAASFNGPSCTEAVRRPPPRKDMVTPKFSKTVNGTVATEWIRTFFKARQNSLDRMHITADRFVRYLRTDNVGDSLMDLCISLESLLDSQTEVSFRFGTHLAKVTGERGQKTEETAKLLSSLYDLRSKIVHGADATKERVKLEPHLPALHRAARVELTDYVLFMSDHTRADWRQHLHTLLFE